MINPQIPLEGTHVLHDPVLAECENVLERHLILYTYISCLSSTGVNIDRIDVSFSTVKVVYPSEGRLDS